MVQQVSLPDSRIQVCGLPWFCETAPRLCRFPERMKDELPEGIFAAGRQTAGVRLRFRTDTTRLGLLAEFPPFEVRTNMTQFTTHGISVYVDGPCWSARIPEPEGGKAGLELFSEVPRQMREICLYLPLYGTVEILEIHVDEEARFEPPSPFALDRPVVFYGTSITQGGCASRPGLSYQAVVSRKLHIDYVNLGFSGMGKCELALAGAMAQIEKASCFVLDVGQNNSVEELRERFAPFVDLLQEKRPEIPLLATAPIFYNAELWSSKHQATVEEKREIVRMAVAGRKEKDDSQVYLLEAKDYLWSDFADGAVDGGHPNDLGFDRMARGMGCRLAEILKLEK